MALPETVEVVFAASDPVLANVLNKLQESVAGDLHPIRPILLPASLWTPKALGGRGAGGSTALMGDGQWVWGGFAPCYLVCPISQLIPEGHELTRVRWYYNRNGAGTPTRAMYSRNMATGAADVAVFGPTNIAAGAAWTSVDDNALGYIMPAETSLELEFKLDNAANVFGGARLEYRKLP